MLTPLAGVRLELSALAEVDCRRHALVGFVAGDPDPAGIARLVVDAHDRTVAEVACAVADPYHGLGVGTALMRALVAGAEFVVAPSLNLDVIRLCRRYDKLVMPGAFTPTEVLTAWEAGADVVKVFPADVVGPAFFKALRGPLPLPGGQPARLDPIPLKGFGD